MKGSWTHIQITEGQRNFTQSFVWYFMSYYTLIDLNKFSGSAHDRYMYHTPDTMNWIWKKKYTCFYIFSYIFVKLVSENSCITVCVAIDFSKKSEKTQLNKIYVIPSCVLGSFHLSKSIYNTCSFWSIPLIKRPRDVGSSDGSETFEHQVIIMNRQSPPPPSLFSWTIACIYIVCVFIVFLKIQFQL